MVDPTRDMRAVTHRLGAVDIATWQAGDPTDPLVILLHGFPEHGAMWHDQMMGLADRYHVVAPDQRGFDRSGKPADPAAYRIEALVGDVVGLIAAAGQPRLHGLIGHDWGGAVAWAVAIARPDLVERLIVLNAPHPYLFAEALRGDAEQQAASAYMDLFRQPHAADYMAADNFARLKRFFFEHLSWADAVDGDKRAAYEAAWSRPGALTAMLNWYRATPLAPPSPTYPGPPVLDPADFRVTVPTTVVWGLEDTALRPVLLDGLGDLVDDLTVHRVPGAGHWVIHEAPMEVLRHLRAALAR